MSITPILSQQYQNQTLKKIDKLKKNTNIPFPKNYSFASPIPSALIANIASDSGKQGES